MLFHLITFEVVKDLQLHSRNLRAQLNPSLEVEGATTIATLYRSAMSAFRDEGGSAVDGAHVEDLDDHITTQRLEGEDGDAFFPRFEMPKTKHRPSTILAYLCVFYTIVMTFGSFLIVMAAVTAAIWYNAHGER